MRHNSPFLYFQRGECPICQGAKKGCRQNRESQIIHCRDRTANPPGFRFLQEDGIGFLMWIAGDRTASQESWDQYQQRKPAQEKARQKSLRPLLSLEQRDRDYRKLPQGLAQRHRQALQQRGLTDEMIQIAESQKWLKTHEPWISTTATPDLAGIDPCSKKTLGVPGIAIAAVNLDGQITGYQIGSDDREQYGKYIWLSSASRGGSSPHLPNQELPIFVWQHPDAAPVSRPRVYFLEGGLKSLYFALKVWFRWGDRNAIVIGAAGGNLHASRKTVQATLTQLHPASIVLMPDAGTTANQQILNHCRKTVDLCQGYPVTIGWWGQISKGESPDPDELEDLSRVTEISIGEFEAIADQWAPPPKNWLAQIQQTLERKYQPEKSAGSLQRRLDGPDRIGKENTQENPVVEPKPATTSSIVEYAAGDRNRVHQDAIQQGYKFVLDLSPPGCGKSYDAGKLAPGDFGDAVRQIIYASASHRNPTVETLSHRNGWVDLEARHHGLLRENTPGGSERSRRTKSGEIPSVASNCNRTRLIGALREKHVAGSDSAALICGGCPLQGACSHSQGPGFGFLHQRRSALSSPRLRAHPDSFPSPAEYDYSEVVVTWDEPGESFTVKRDVQVTELDLQQTITALFPHSDLSEALKPLLLQLLSYLNGTTKVKKFGLTHAEVVDLLPVPGVEAIAVGHLLQPNLGFLNSTADYGVDLADLSPALRKKFTDKDSDLAEKAEQKVIKQWLPDLLRVLTGEVRGALHLDQNVLTLSLPDERHRAIAQAAKATIFSDGTLNQRDLALKLGVPESEIFVCRQSVPNHGNLTITQVRDLKRMARQRGKDQQARAAAIVKHYASDPDTRVIDFKCFAKKGQGVWYRDSRGVNDFERIKRLVLVGTPCRNIPALLAEHRILTGGTSLEDEGFQAFINRTIHADFHQAIGRLRAHRRPDEQLEIIILSNFELDIPTQMVDAAEITLDAASPWDKFKLAIQQAVEQLKISGQKITQTAIASLSGYSQSYISRHWKLLQTLLEALIAKVIKNPDPPPDPDDTILVATASRALEDAIAESDPQERLQNIDEVFYEWLKPNQWPQVWSLMSGKSQVAILQALLAIASPAELID